jgi:hypothetical protein
MKTTQAWGWLAAGVLALGLNGVYQDGGAAWVNRAVSHVLAQMVGKSGAVLALAAGRADWFMVKVSDDVTQDEPASCRAAAAMARVRAKMARMQGGMARFEAMSEREEAQLARFEANRARIEAQVERVRFVAADFPSVRIPEVCPRVNVRVPRINIPQPPMVRIPEVHVEMSGTGPV